MPKFAVNAFVSLIYEETNPPMFIVFLNTWPHSGFYINFNEDKNFINKISY